MDATLGVIDARPGTNPEVRAILGDLRSRLPFLLWRLPPPYRQIALLRLVHQTSRAAVIAYLQAWRPVGENEGRRLIQLTNAMLRALGRERDPSELWPQTGNPKRNRWLTIPPPPI